VLLAAFEWWLRALSSAAARRAPVPVIYGLLAVTALEHRLIFVTRDSQYLAANGVAYFDSWTT
jgi:predicted nucleic acid-binding protein